VQWIHAVLFHHGAPALGEGALRTEKGVAALRTAAVGCLSPAGQLQVATALEVIEALEARLHAVRHQLLAAARQLAGARVRCAGLRWTFPGPAVRLRLTRRFGAAPGVGSKISLTSASAGRESLSDGGVPGLGGT
jgi:transposase